MWKLFLFVFLFPASYGSQAQSLRLIHTTYIGGTQFGCAPYDAFLTKDKGIFFCGITQDSGTGDIPIYPTNNINGNVIIGKVDSLGNKEWVRVWGNSGFDIAGTACQASDGGYAILSPLDSNSGDIKLQKTDVNGNLLWTKSYGSSRQDWYINLISTADKGFLIFGVSKGYDGDIPFNYTPQTSFQPWDWILIKTDSLGNKQWVKVYGTSGDESSGGRLVTDGVNYFLISSTISKDHDCIDSTTYPGHPGNSIYVLKIDTAGSVIWSHSYGVHTVNNALFDDRDSTIVITGIGNPYLPFSGGHGANNNDMFLLKIDRDGGYKWSGLFGDSNYDRGKALAKGPNKGYVLVGITEFQVQTSYNHIGLEDNWIVLVDSVGNIIHQRLYGAKDEDGVCAVVPFKDGFATVGYCNNYSFTEGSGHNYVSTNPLRPEMGNTTVSYFQLWPLSIPDLNENKKEIKVYPNPARQYIKIELFPNHNNGLLSIKNSTGIEVYQNMVTKKDLIDEINTSGWKPGVYIASWKEAGNTLESSRFILE